MKINLISLNTLSARINTFSCYCLSFKKVDTYYNITHV